MSCLSTLNEANKRISETTYHIYRHLSPVGVSKPDLRSIGSGPGPPVANLGQLPFELMRRTLDPDPGPRPF